MLIKFREMQGQKVKSNECNFNDDLVLLRVETRQKLEPLWKGPFEMKAMQGPSAIIQKLGKRKKQEVHMNRLKLYFSLLSGAKDASAQVDPYVNTMYMVEATTNTNSAGGQVKDR
jgi:hypothetical protein